MIASQVSEVTLVWLGRLRWVAACGQLLALGVSFALSWRVSFWVLMVVAFLTASSNLVLQRLSPTRRVVFGVLGLDILLLTLLLVGSGGASSPFSLLYLVHITLGAVLLDARSIWWLSGLAIGCYGLLFFLPADPHAHHQSSEDFSLHLYGMWFAFALTALALAYFVARISEALAERELELSSAKEKAVRSERLASLSTLAAGAAHELSTPLATIAVSSKELERSAKDPAVLEEARLIRAEVERCRAILTRMRAQAGESVGEPPSKIEPEELKQMLFEGLGPKLSPRVELSLREIVVAPKMALVQSLVNLIRNGLDASEGLVSVSLNAGEKTNTFEVKDRGPQLEPSLLERVGEPFFTTKPPGVGMGLGFFLSANFAAMMGGRCWLSSSKDGTTATLELPRVGIV